MPTGHNQDSLYQGARLAEAAYADIPQSARGNATALRDALVNGAAGFSVAQAEQFAEAYDFVDQYNDLSGMSATVFRDKQSGQYIVSARGTELPGDLIRDVLMADVEIALTGVDKEQAYALWNYFQRLITPAGQAALQYLPEITHIGERAPIISYSMEQTPGTGIGLLASAPSLSFAGHSLGGNLAMTLARLVSGENAVHALGAVIPPLDSVYTYNAVGFHSIAEGGFFNRFPGATGYFSPTYDVFDEGGPEIITNADFFLHPGQRIAVHTEGFFLSEGTHSSSALTDSLALQSFLQTLDPTLTLSQLNTIIDGAAGAENGNDGGNQDAELDNLVAALQTLLLGRQWNPQIATGGRQSLYVALGQLYLSTAYQSATQDGGVSGVRVLSLHGLSSDALLGLMRQPGAEGQAYRLAALHLLPVALVGSNVNSSALSSDDESAWQSHSPEYWRTRATFLSAMLQGNYAEDAGEAGLPYSAAFLDRDYTQLDAIGHGSTRRVTFATDAGESLTGFMAADWLFGGSGDDTLEGRDGSDFLEGGNGVDTLVGGQGGDVLLGGTGDDLLFAGYRGNVRGADSNATVNFLVGGDGDDKYYYNTGDGTVHIYDSDRIGSIHVNGQPIGQLFPASDSGQQHVWYTQGGGQGQRCVWDAVTQTLTIHTEVGGSIIIHANSNTLPAHIRRLIDNGASPLTVQAVANATSVSSNSSAPDVGLGITIEEPEEYQGEWSLNLSDLNPSPEFGSDQDSHLIEQRWRAWNSNEVVQHQSWDVNVLLEVRDHPNADDLTALVLRDRVINDSGMHAVITGSDGDSYLEGGELGDHISGNGPRRWGENGVSFSVVEDGDDRIYGRGGADWLFGMWGNDYLDGGTGDDYLNGDSTPYFVIADGVPERLENYFNTREEVSADVLLGGSGDDWLDGGVGRDFLEGGEGEDQLFGGAHSDVLLGGEGNDRIYADLQVIGYGENLLGARWVSHDINVVSHAGNDYVDGGAGNDEIMGGSGHDTLLGGEGNDNILGDGYLPDEITTEDLQFAGDQLPGYVFADSQQQPGNDYIDGGEGNDQLVGGGGADLILGGSGNDTIYGGHLYTDAPGHGNSQADISQDAADEIYGGEGNDNIRAGNGNDIAHGDAGTDQLRGEVGDDELHGGADGDGLWGGEGNDRLYGDAGGDLLYGDEGDDTLIGGAETDGLYGGIGNDTYIQSIGDGRDIIQDNSGSNRLVMAGRLASAQVYFGNGQVTILLDANNGVQMDAGTFSAMAEFQFHDGIFSGFDVLSMVQPTNSQDPVIDVAADVNFDEVSVHAVGDDLYLTYSGEVSDWLNVDALLNQGILAVRATLPGTSEQAIVLPNWFRATNPATYASSLSNGTQSLDLTQAGNLPRQHFGTVHGDAIDGGDGHDVISAGAGDDRVNAGAGNDTLTGGQGSDLLEGGTGNDRYHFALGDGADQILDAAGTDTIRFGEGISAAQLQLREINGGLEIVVSRDAEGNPVDQLFIANWINGQDNQIEGLEFADGSTLDAAGIEALIGGNHAPDVGTPLSDQQLNYGAVFQFSVPEGTFQDVDSTDSLTYVARLADGGSLPEWLQFDAATQTFSGVYEPESLIPIDVVVYAIDQQGTYRSDVFRVSVSGLILGTAAANTINGDEGNNAIDGLGGFDTLRGNGGNDFLNGGEGNDSLYGGDGNDRLHGGIGNDALIGGVGNNIYRINVGDGKDTLTFDRNGTHVVEFGAGIDAAQVAVSFTSNGQLSIRYSNTPGDELLLATAVVAIGTEGFDFSAAFQLQFSDGRTLNGNEVVALAVQSMTDAAEYFWGLGSGDTVSLHGGNDVARGQDGADTIFGGDGADDIYGQNGADTLYGDAGDDEIWGDGTHGEDGVNSGVDHVYGGDGNDTIYAGLGDDVVEGGDGDDTLMGGYSSSYSEQSGNDTIRGGAGNDTIRGADGDDILNGDDGVDYIYGGNGIDTIDGGTGDDYLSGGYGQDTYLFRLGSGNDTIWAPDVAYGPQDRLIFEGGITSEDVVMSRVGANLVITIFRYGESVTIRNWYTSAAYQLDRITFSDISVGYNYVQEYFGVVGTNEDDAFTGTPMNDRYFGLNGNDVIHGMNGDDRMHGNDGNDVLFGGDGRDELNGGAGNDILIAGAGFDRYFFEVGFGQDIIRATRNGIDSDYYNPSSVDHERIHFGEGITLASLQFERVENPEVGTQDLRIMVGTNGDSLTIENFFANPFSYSISSIVFSESYNPPLDWEQFVSLVFGAAVVNDTINGTSGNDVLGGGAGNDTISLADGDDMGFGGDNTDTIAGGEGNDTLYGNAGADTLYGDAGDDCLIGGTGNDTLYGGAGADRFEMGFGQGQDIVYAIDSDGVNADRIRIDVSFTSATLTRSGTDLIVTYSVSGATHKVTIKEYFSVENFDTAVGSLEFSDGVLIWQEVANLVRNNSSTEATTGNDFLFGAQTELGEGEEDTIEEVDTIDALAGNDLVYGFDGADTINGSAGNDVIYGGTGNDTLYGDASIATSTTSGADILSGGAGTDTIRGNRGNDIIDGGDDNDMLYGGFGVSGTESSGADTIRGGNGADQIWGNDGNDQITGGTGNDVIAAGAGSDTVFFGRGDGQDTVSFTDTATTRTDLLQLNSGIATNQVRLVRGGVGNNDLIVQIIGSTDQVTVTGYFAATSNRLTGIRFTDGAITWNQSQIQALVDANVGTNQVRVADMDTIQTESIVALHWQASALDRDVALLNQAMAGFGSETETAVFGAVTQETVSPWLAVSSSQPLRTHLQ